VNPPPIKRSQRDPYGDWWDKQERRNYGEPIHEDNDTLGIFSLEEYNVFTPGQAAKGGLIYIGSILSLCGLVYLFYPDLPATPRTYPGGLDIELGGEGSLPVRIPLPLCRLNITNMI
jgi:NADH dehydrogenase (ubiquinone) 1 beta subcomplex subunit 8